MMGGGQDAKPGAGQYTYENAVPKRVILAMTERRTMELLQDDTKRAQGIMAEQLHLRDYG